MLLGPPRTQVVGNLDVLGETWHLLLAVWEVLGSRVRVSGLGGLRWS